MEDTNAYTKGLMTSMKKNKNPNFQIALLTLSFTTLFLSFAPVARANNDLQTEPIGNIVSGEVVSIQSGASSSGTVDRGINSSSARVGDRGYITLSQGLNSIPAGTRVEFTVSRVSPARRGFNKPGEIQLKAVQLTYPDGKSGVISGDAYVVNSDADGTIIKGTTTGKRVGKVAANTAVGAGVGALGGLVGGAISGGRLGKGAAIGAGIGAASGVVASGFDKGKDVNINSGEKMTLRFTKSAQISVK